MSAVVRKINPQSIAMAKNALARLGPAQTGSNAVLFGGCIEYAALLQSLAVSIAEASYRQHATAVKVHVNQARATVIALMDAAEKFEEAP